MSDRKLNINEAAGKKNDTYEVEVGGVKRRVTVPEDPAPEDILADALRETLSPRAVAAIAAYLQPARTNDPDTNRQIAWFRRMLVETVGGDDTLNRLCDEAGL